MAGTELRIASKRKRMIKLTLKFISLGVALVFFFLSSFFKEQFGKHNIELKIVVAIALSVVAVVITILAEELKEKLKMIEQWHFLVRTIVRFVLLELASLVIFLTKYPRFKTDVPKTCQKMIFGNRCHLFSAAAFSAYSLLFSGDGDETTKLGISDFFLQMTMEASMGINHNTGKPDLWYIVGAAAYCFLLILYKSSGSRLSSTDRSSTGLEEGVADRRSGHDGPDLSDDASSINRGRNSDEGHQQPNDESNDRHHQKSADRLRKRNLKPEKLESDGLDGAGHQSNNTSNNEDGQSNTSTAKGDPQLHFEDRHHQISTDGVSNQQPHDENNDRHHQKSTDGLRKRNLKPEKLESDVLDGAGHQNNNTSNNEDGQSNTSTDKGDPQLHFEDRHHQISTDGLPRISFKLAVLSVLSAIRFMPDGNKDN